jgi:hypothetical protein
MGEVNPIKNRYKKLIDNDLESRMLTIARLAEANERLHLYLVLLQRR